MKVYITGATGWIGSYCAHILKDVRVGAIEQATHLLHLAWDVQPGYWNRKSNINCFLDTCEYIQNFVEMDGKRIVVAGTCANESTLYGRSKASVEKVLDAYRVTGVSTAYARIHYLYGPGEQPQRLIPSIIRAILKSETVKIDHPSQMLDYLYVEDVAGALCAILENDDQGTIDVGFGEAITTLRIAQMIKGIMGRGMIAMSDVPSWEYRVANTTMLSKYWKPKWSWEAGLGKTIDWWKDEIILRHNVE